MLSTVVLLSDAEKQFFLYWAIGASCALFDHQPEYGSVGSKLVWQFLIDRGNYSYLVKFEKIILKPSQCVMKVINKTFI